MTEIETGAQIAMIGAGLSRPVAFVEALASVAVTVPSLPAMLEGH